VPIGAVTVRELAPGEWRTWRDLRTRALVDAPDAFAQLASEVAGLTDAEWQDRVSVRADRAVLVAEHAGAAIGTCVLVLTDDRRRTNLFAMWVAPEARRTGAGRRLIEAAIVWARRRALSAIELSVSVPAGPARALYHRLGFRDTGAREPLRDGSAIDVAAMTLALRPLVMGVVNVTPDSFSDGGRYLEPRAAIDHGLALRAAGAELLDVGGEATNPRAEPTTAAEELDRVLPVIEGLAGAATVSIDTTKAEVARAAVAAGAAIVNDISGGLFDPAMAAVIDELPVTYIAGHLRGARLADVFAAERPASWREVADELAVRLAALGPAARARCWVDPGVGFGKGADPDTNVKLLAHAGDLGRALSCPVVVGPSRKRFLRTVIGASADSVALDAASVAACLGAVRGGAQVLRVHNVALLEAALAVYTRF
jgi:dihydropteroate synthase